MSNSQKGYPGEPGTQPACDRLLCCDQLCEQGHGSKFRALSRGGQRAGCQEAVHPERLAGALALPRERVSQFSRSFTLPSAREWPKAGRGAMELTTL